MTYRLGEHTADVAVEIEAPDLPSLFRDAARAYRNLVVTGEVHPRLERKIELEAEGLPDLLVAFLSELVYLCEAEGLLVTDLEFDEVTPNRLRATARGEPMDPHRHRPGIEIKAATYHDLCVEETPEGWTARVVFDI